MVMQPEAHRVSIDGHPVRSFELGGRIRAGTMPGDGVDGLLRNTQPKTVSWSAGPH
jgi:hypothetical protein